MKFTSTAAFLRFSAIVAVSCRSRGSVSLLPFVCWCVGYGGNNVGALSKSTRAEEREREIKRERREGGKERKREMEGRREIKRESTRGITDAAGW